MLDPVGVAGSTFRRNKCMALMERVHPTCIRGNYSEILALMRQRNTAVGVDAADTDMDLDALQQFADEVHGIVVASGEKDYITDGKRLYVCERGHRMMSHITGSGCMSSVALATFFGSGTFDRECKCLLSFSWSNGRTCSKTDRRESRRYDDIS